MGFCGTVRNKKTGNGPHSMKTTSPDLASFRLTHAHFLGEYPDLEPLDESEESPVIVPPLAFNVLPLASTTCLIRPYGRPFLVGIKVTVTSSPGLKDAFPKPA